MSDIKKTLNERGKSYGDFSEQAHLVLKIIDALMYKQPATYSNEAYHATYMIVTKLARLWQGDINHVDSWHDIAGYAELARREAEKKQ